MEIRKLNTLRGIAALIVFMTHFSDSTNWLGGVLGGGAGAYGVMLFFLLSGFLMSYLYLDKAFTKTAVAQYFLARVARIVPLYLLIVLVSYFSSSNGHSFFYHIPDINTALGHLLFVYGESVLWSIPVEVQFYGVFVIFWALAQKRRGFIYLLIVAVMITLFFTNFPRIYGEVNGVPYNLFNVLRSLPFFFMGVVFGLHYRTLKVPEYLKSHWFVLSLCLVPLLYPEFSPVTTGDKTRMWLSFEVLLVMSSVFFGIVFLVPNNNWLLANKVGDFIGKVSYSLYLLHLPIISAISTLHIAVELQLLLSLVLSVLAAYLSYRYFEQAVARFIRSRSAKQYTKHHGIKQAKA